MWWTRKRKARRQPPPEGPTLADIQRAAREAEEARLQLQQVQQQAPAVETAAQHLERKLRENNIGPRFWAALGERRG